jgi:alcohol dehydrogenase
MYDKMKDVEIKLQAWNPTKIHFGEGTMNSVGEVIEKYSNSVLVIIGQTAAKQGGYLDKIEAILDEKGIQHNVCDGVEPNPSMETVYRITYHILAEGFKCLLAVGGGSVMDAAKAAGILSTIKEGDLQDYFGAGMVSKKISKIMPLVVIPSTSGSGSEVTKFSVITDTRLNVKKMIIDPAIIPTEAIVDPELTYSCPKHVTLVSGLDAMTHLIEGYLNTVDENVDPEANDRALMGLELLIEALPAVIRKPADKEGRRKMSLASLLGGTVLLYKQAGGPHLNSFSWSHVMDHGEACAVMLPYYVVYYAPAIMEKITHLSELFGIRYSGNAARDFAEGLQNFYKKVGFPTTLKEFEGFSEALIDKAVGDASQNQMKLKVMPRPIPTEKADEILRTIITGAYNGKMEQISKL